MPTLRDIGEFEAIHRLTAARGGLTLGAGVVGAGSGGREVPAKSPGAAADALARVVVDSGDDAAVVRPLEGSDLVATTDAFVEGRHFAPEFFTAREVGARLATANLSDLAAMAARPRWALLSIGVRAEHDIEVLVEVQAGLAETLAADGATLVGGNLVAVEGREWLNLTLLGEAPRGRAWRRAGARAGDLLAVTGWPGRAGAGARMAQRFGADAGRNPEWRELLDAWIRPRARVALALALAPLGAVTAAVDISDGFAGDLSHLCEASGVGAEVDEAAWPADPLIESAAQALGLEPQALAFGPSDDYELLLTVAPGQRAACEAAAREAGVRLGFVGRITSTAGAVVLRAADGTRREMASAGYDHFG